MNASSRAVVRVFACLAVIACFAGCVERTVSISTEPEGATVFLNDQDMGKSPVKVPFTWYGDYDIIVRKPGFQTIKTNHRIDAPWYQWPIFDVVSECFVPVTIHDDRVLDPYVLQPSEYPSNEALLKSADEMRGRVQNPEF